MDTEGTRSLRWTLLGFLVVGSVLASVLVAPSASAAPAPCGAVDETETLTVSVTSPKASYKVGSIARLDVTVTRGSGDHSGPAAEEAEVLAGVALRRASVVGVGITDDAGKATIRVRIPKSARPGRARANVEASLDYLHGCLPIHEHGHFRGALFSVYR